MRRRPWTCGATSSQLFMILSGPLCGPLKSLFHPVPMQLGHVTQSRTFALQWWRMILLSGNKSRKHNGRNTLVRKPLRGGKRRLSILRPAAPLLGRVGSRTWKTKGEYGFGKKATSALGGSLLHRFSVFYTGLVCLMAHIAAGCQYTRWCGCTRSVKTHALEKKKKGWSAAT